MDPEGPPLGDSICSLDLPPMVGMVRRFFQLISASFIAAATISLALVMAIPAHAESLSESGTVLTDQRVNFSNADITRLIDLNGDTPSVTYVMAHTLGGKRMQRTNLGYWIPWSGDVDELIDNRFQASGDSLVYKVVSQDISGFMFPITFVLAYRVGETLKFGVFQVSPN